MFCKIFKNFSKQFLCAVYGCALPKILGHGQPMIHSFNFSSVLLVSMDWPSQELEICFWKVLFPIDFNFQFLDTSKSESLIMQPKAYLENFA